MGERRLQGPRPGVRPVCGSARSVCFGAVPCPPAVIAGSRARHTTQHPSAILLASRAGHVLNCLFNPNSGVKVVEKIDPVTIVVQDESPDYNEKREARALPAAWARSCGVVWTKEA